MDSSYAALDKIAVLMMSLTIPLKIEGRLNNISKKGKVLGLNSRRIQIFEENCTWQEFSKKRAESVAQYIHSQGINHELAVPYSIEDQQPISTEPEKVQQNRCVNFSFLVEGEKKEEGSVDDDCDDEKYEIWMKTYSNSTRA